MNYKKIKLNLENPLSFWSHFSGEERFYWYDRQKEQLIIGAERLCAVKNQTNEYPYLFHTQSFFEGEMRAPWQNMGDETLAFKHYYVKTSHESLYLTCTEPATIEPKKVLEVTHSLTQKEDDFEEWAKLFNQIQKSFKAGESQKIVASREIDFTSSQDFCIESILHKLSKNNPNCFIFAYQKGEKTFLGASPEVLVQKDDDEILSYALAGTISKTEINAAERLLNDPKNQFEHHIVIDKIRAQLLKKTSQVTVEETGLMELKNVYHLRTLLHAKDHSTSLTEWGAHLHPTPALGGEPSDYALNFLRHHEHHERGLYAAPLGIIDGQGNGTLVVGIRSALIEGKTLRAYVGCGIVPYSDVRDEFNETKVKLKTILEAL